LAFDSAGNLFVTDSLDIVPPGHGHVYKFTPGGVRTTFASGFISPEGLASDSAGNLFLVDGGDIDGLGGAIYKFHPRGTRNTFVSAKHFCIGPGLTIDGADNLFVPDWCTGNIYKFTPRGHQSTFVSGLGLNESFSFLAF
jgi:sugar lactone lactonase YvrE